MKRFLRGRWYRIRRFRRSLRSDAAAIAGLIETFDAAWYLESYPDVAEAGLDPLRHFRDHGVDEGRVPNAYIDPEWYARFYLDVGSAPPLLHYARIGRRERRDPGPGFGVGAYLHANPDVAAAGIEPLAHYIRHGRAEGRRAFRSVLAAGGAKHDDDVLASQAPDAVVSLHVRDEVLLRIHETFRRRGSRIAD